MRLFPSYKCGLGEAGQSPEAIAPMGRPLPNLSRAGRLLHRGFLLDQLLHRGLLLDHPLLHGRLVANVPLVAELLLLAQHGQMRAVALAHQLVVHLRPQQYVEAVHQWVRAAQRLRIRPEPRKDGLARAAVGGPETARQPPRCLGTVPTCLGVLGAVEVALASVPKGRIGQTLPFDQSLKR